MTVVGLTLPFFSTPDPDVMSEGSIDPMGLAPVSDQLAEHLAPEVTSRMNRIRFLTPIAACALVCQDLQEIPPADGRTPPYLAAEWNIVEGFAHRLPASETLNIAGIQKTRATIRRGGRLDHPSYLKAAKVFGFHGIYKRLARAFDLVEGDMLHGAAMDQLLRIWEREQTVEGFVDNTPRSNGASFRRALREATLGALLAGHVTTRPSSFLFGRTTQAFHPERQGRQEKKWLWGRLLNEQGAARRELVEGLAPMCNDQPTDRSALRAVLPGASPGLRARIDAIDSFETMAEALVRAFDVLRFVSAAESWITPDKLASHRLVGASAQSIRDLTVKAEDEIELLDPAIATLFDITFGAFASVTSTDSFVEALLDHHERVQREKDNRSWYERSSRGLIIRPKFGLDVEPVMTGEYIRPYRVQALLGFARDAR